MLGPSSIGMRPGNFAPGQNPQGPVPAGAFNPAGIPPQMMQGQDPHRAIMDAMHFTAHLGGAFTNMFQTLWPQDAAVREHLVRNLGTEGADKFERDHGPNWQPSAADQRLTNDEHLRRDDLPLPVGRALDTVTTCSLKMDATIEAHEASRSRLDAAIDGVEEEDGEETEPASEAEQLTALITHSTASEKRFGELSRQCGVMAEGLEDLHWDGLTEAEEADRLARIDEFRRQQQVFDTKRELAMLQRGVLEELRAPFAPEEEEDEDERDFRTPAGGFDARAYLASENFREMRGDLRAADEIAELPNGIPLGFRQRAAEDVDDIEDGI